MNRRLQQFLELEQMTPSRLADILGIQRSGISHILSGRNKPGYDFINKFLLKFPNISGDWLITGKGKPYKNIENNDFSENIPENHTSDEIVFPPENVDYEENSNNSSALYPQQDDIKSDSPAGFPVKKNVKRITLFYSDGSFQEFYPNK